PTYLVKVFVAFYGLNTAYFDAFSGFIIVFLEDRGLPGKKTTKAIGGLKKKTFNTAVYDLLHCGLGESGRGLISTCGLTKSGRGLCLVQRFTAVCYSIKGKENRKLLIDSVLNGTATTPIIVRKRRYDELTDAEKLHEACDIKETNIVLQGLPQDIYNLVNHHEEAKHIWDRAKLLIKGFEILLRERDSKLYDEFKMFTLVPRETIHSYYLRFAQLINNMHSIRMTMRQIQVNTTFINHLQPEWSKFVTDVKLAKDLNNTNFDHLYGYLRQHEAHVDEVRLMKERFLNILELVANTYNFAPSYSNQTQYHQQLSHFASQQQVSPLASQQLYDVPMVQQHSSQAPIANHSSLFHHQSYQPLDVHQPSQESFPVMDSRLIVPSFLPSDDLIASLNKAMDFISTTFTSRYPPINNQLRTLSNPRNQATI
ncbi:hypothetical protein Tco_0764010, partial [Tanacetum coccineum]